MSYREPMPYGFGKFNDNEPDKPSVRQATIHPITRLKLHESYIPIDDKDRQRATATATKLRKSGTADIKYSKGIFTRWK